MSLRSLLKVNVREMLTDEQKKSASQAFDDVDDTKTGIIPNTRTMFLEAAQLTGLNPTQREIDKTWNQDLGELLTKDQFLDLISGLEWKEHDEMEAQLKSDFAIFDPELTGAIEYTDLIHILSKEGRNRMDEEKAREIVKTFEKDENGHINIQGLIDQILSPRPQIEVNI